VSALGGLRDGIERDRRELKRFMDGPNIAASRPRKSAAWMSAKLTEMKLRLEDGATGPVRLLESVEIVAPWHRRQAGALALSGSRRRDCAGTAPGRFCRTRRARPRAAPGAPLRQK